MICGRAAQQPCVERQLAAVGGNRQGVIDAGIDLLGAQALVARNELGLEARLLLGHRAGHHNSLAGLQAGAGQVEHVRRLHVGKRPEHLLELRQVDEPGEAAAGT